MKKLLIRSALAASLTAGLLAGCGGSSDVQNPPQGNGGGTQQPNIGQNVSDLIAYMKALIATDENSDAVDINPLTLATDDMGDPAPL